MTDDVPPAFAAFMAARYDALARSAYLLLGDRGHAEDLVQAALLKTYRAWDSLRAAQAAEAFTRTTMVRLAGRQARRRWRGEIPSDDFGADSASAPEADVRNIESSAAVSMIMSIRR